jgi:hypothetical protein
MREDARQIVGAPGGDPLLGEALGKVSGDGRAAHAFQNSSDVALALCDASLTSFRTTDAQRDAFLARLTLDFSRSQVIELRASMLAIVPELVVRHPLRGYDAVQLAAALHVRASGNSVELWSTDETLRVAALAPARSLAESRWAIDAVAVHGARSPASPAEGVGRSEAAVNRAVLEGAGPGDGDRASVQVEAVSRCPNERTSVSPDRGVRVCRRLGGQESSAPLW